MAILLLMTCAAVAADAELAAGPVETVAEGFKFTEGPVWLPGEGFIFSDTPADTIFRADKRVYRSPSGQSNGLTLDRQGRLIACEHGNRRVTRTEKDGTITVLADTYLGRKLNSPNDVVVRSDGMILFTDPPYGVPQEDRELEFCGVYAITPDKQVKLLSVYFKYPNGLALSPDEKTLYVGDSGLKFIQAFHVEEDATLSHSRFFCDADPDGMKVDVLGRLWTTDGPNVSVFTPDGTRVGEIPFPQQPANCAFGGDDSKTLFVTARTGVYQVKTMTAGIHPSGF
ncbi:MAG TPA: SMP-30/gluconolactonase/LRE family protein [Candidatus Hydrogenedentes bacterium]|nr:SMP-30/gluconolactonase/LRE family protein [Candidatus Hydrogenedentota bacterium]HPG70099.1 SMP-30/gluconolactonase/LRE family protein [Candidatus Hydrogenedentota bacterium]